MEAITCARCHKVLPDSAAYCRRCGLMMDAPATLRHMMADSLNLASYAMVFGVLIVAPIAGVAAHAHAGGFLFEPHPGR